VNLITWQDSGVPLRVSGILVHTICWPSLILVLVVVAFGMLARLLAEWQRRRTLLALMKHAPGGTVILQGRGHGGPAMWVTVGSGSRKKLTSCGGR
jgi:hypothetical protein